MPKYKVEFAALKERVGMEAICYHYGIVLKKAKDSTWVSGDCPLPQHKSDVKGSLKINLENEKWHCKSDSCKEARDGRAGGDIISFVAWKEAVNYRKAGELIEGWFPGSTVTQEVAPDEGEQAPPAVMRPEIVAVKAERYMDQLDAWLRELLRPKEGLAWEVQVEKIVKDFKRKVLESYRNGRDSVKAA
jgi:hypothetical protein